MRWSLLPHAAERERVRSRRLDGGRNIMPLTVAPPLEFHNSSRIWPCRARFRTRCKSASEGTRRERPRTPDRTYPPAPMPSTWDRTPCLPYAPGGTGGATGCWATLCCIQPAIPMPTAICAPTPATPPSLPLWPSLHRLPSSRGRRHSFESCPPAARRSASHSESAGRDRIGAAAPRLPRWQCSPWPCARAAWQRPFDLAARRCAPGPRRTR